MYFIGLAAFFSYKSFAVGEKGVFVEQELVLSVYNSWEKLVEKRASGLHWGLDVTIYLNKAVDVYYFNAMCYRDECSDADEEPTGDNRYRKYPEGTMLVKENYHALESTKAGELHSLTVMIKRAANYDTENGDWQYFELIQQRDGRFLVNLEGSHGNKGVAQNCSGCHFGAKDRDFVFSTFY